MSLPEIKRHELSFEYTPGTAAFRVDNGLTIRRAYYGLLVNEVFKRGNVDAFRPVSEDEARCDASGFKRMARRMLDEPIRKRNRQRNTA